MCWDERLIPPHIENPYTYPGFESKKSNKNKPRQIDLIKYFCGQNVVSDLIGRVDSNYKAWAAIKGPASDECVRLGQLFSRIVDSAKSGEQVKLEQYLRVPKDKRHSPSDTSPFVWLKMEYYATVFVEEHLRTGTMNIENSISMRDAISNDIDDDGYYEEEMIEQRDIVFDLLSRNHLAMSEFTKVSIVPLFSPHINYK